jgi:hypothetical protein
VLESRIVRRTKAADIGVSHVGVAGRLAQQYLPGQ